MNLLKYISGFLRPRKRTFKHGDSFNIIDFYYSVESGKQGVFIVYEWPSGIGDTAFIDVQKFLDLLHEFISVKWQWTKLESGKYHPEIYAGGSKGFLPLSVYLDRYVVDGLINLILKKSVL